MRDALLLGSVFLFTFVAAVGATGLVVAAQRRDPGLAARCAALTALGFLGLGALLVLLLESGVVGAAWAPAVVAGVGAGGPGEGRE